MWVGDKYFPDDEEEKDYHKDDAGNDNGDDVEYCNCDDPCSMCRIRLAPSWILTWRQVLGV